eukprot:1165707-Rhodomonas_salina.3
MPPLPTPIARCLPLPPIPYLPMPPIPYRYPVGHCLASLLDTSLPVAPAISLCHRYPTDTAPIARFLPMPPIHRHARTAHRLLIPYASSCISTDIFLG